MQLVQATPFKFKLATCNLLHEADFQKHAISGRMSLSERKNILKNYISTILDNDIIVLQEYTQGLTDDLHKAANNSKHTGKRVFSKKRYGYKKDKSVVILFNKDKFTFVDELHIETTNDGHRAIVAILQPMENKKIIGKPIAIIGCHLAGGPGGHVGYHQHRFNQIKKSIMTNYTISQILS